MAHYPLSLLLLRLQLHARGVCVGQRCPPRLPRSSPPYSTRRARDQPGRLATLLVQHTMRCRDCRSSIVRAAARTARPLPLLLPLCALLLCRAPAAGAAASALPSTGITAPGGELLTYR